MTIITAFAEGYDSAIVMSRGNARLERAWQGYFQRGMARAFALETQSASDWETSMSARGSDCGFYVSGPGSSACTQPPLRWLSAINEPSGQSLVRV